MKKLILAALLLALAPLTIQAQQNVFANGIPTNTTVDATNTTWVCPFDFTSISFTDDSTNEIYTIPSGTNLSYVVCTNLLLTSVNNYRDPIGGTNISSTSITGRTSVCVTNKINQLAAGQGFPLYPNGGNVVFNSTGRPGVRTFQFISKFGNGNNCAIAIGATTPTTVIQP